MARDYLWLHILCLGIFVAALYIWHPISVGANDLPTSIYISICNDGVVGWGELCDSGAGNNNGGYASSTATRTCMPGCLAFGPYCGDGILQTRFGEQCDDGNNTSGDLCSSACTTEVPLSSGSSGGGPPMGSTPSMPASPGTTLSSLETKVVLRGKAFPSASIDILLDGKKVSNVRADSNADFLFSTSDITPGTATFSFLATDVNGISSFTSSATFEVLQSAVTTVTNVFVPPTITAKPTHAAPGELMTLSGQSVPLAKVLVQLNDTGSNALSSPTDGAGNWSLQMDTGSLTNGYHAAKAYFQLATTTKSGFGRSVSFYIGNETPPGEGGTDINGDGKVNLVDFSIFLTDWGKDSPRSDFNQDKKVNLADFSILLFNWTG